ncbi:hypothetical protein Tco_0017773 [Tanacetum coccineum]
MPKPLTPRHKPSQENNYPNQALPNPYIKDTPTSPQVVLHPPFPISPINSHATHTQAPPQSDNQTQHTPPLSPSRESLVDDINQLQDLSNLLAMHLSQQQNNISSSPYSSNLPHTLNINQVETHVGIHIVIGLPLLVYSKDKPCSSCEKEKHHKASFKTKQTSLIKKCLHLLHMDLFGLVTPSSISHEKYTLVIVDEYSRSTIVKRHLKTPYEIFRGRLPNIEFLHVFGYPVFIYNHKDHLGKFDEKADDVDDINIAESERYPPDEYLHPYEPSQRYQVDSNIVQYIEPYEKPEPIVTEADASLDHDDQAAQTDQLDQSDLNDQNDHLVQADEILNDDQPKHSNHNNDNHIIDNLPNTKDVQITKPLSSPTKDTSTPNVVSSIQTESPLSIPSMASLAPQDRWYKDKHIELVNIIGNPGAGMLTRAMAKELSAALAHECFDLKGYSDSDYAGCNMDRKSTSGACQLLGAAAGCCANILWMKSQFTDYNIIYDKVPIFCDNTRDIELHFIPTQYQLADIFTKPLDEPTFKRLIFELDIDLNNLSLNDLRGSNRLHNWYQSLVAHDLGSTRCFGVASMKEKSYHGFVNTAANGIDVYATCVWFLVKRSISRHQHVLIDKETVVEILILLDLKGRISTVGYEVSTASFILINTASINMDDTTAGHHSSTLVVAELHKEDLQTTIGLASLGVTGEEGANPQLSSVKSASTHTEPVYSASTIIHSESASGHDASAAFIAKADPRKTDANDSVSKQQEKTISASKGLETIHTKVGTGKRASYVEKEITFAEKNVNFEDDEFLTSSDLSNSDDAKKEIKLEVEDLSKLVQNVEMDFMDLDSPEDDAPIIIQDEDDEEVHAKKDDVEKSLQPKLSKLLSSHDFSNSLPTKLKELPSKFTDLPREIKELKKHVHKLEIELLGDLKEIPTKLENSPKSSLQTKGELIKKDKGKKAISSKDVEEGDTRSDSDEDASLTGSMVESSKKKKMKKFDFVIEGGDHIHLTAVQIKEQKKIEESVKADLAKKEVELGKDELVDLLGIDVVTDFYKAKLQSTKKIKSSVQYEYHPARTVLNEPCLEIFFRLHQGPGIDDHARTFSSFVLAEVDKRNLNPLKQMRAIEQLRQ